MTAGCNNRRSRRYATLWLLLDLAVVALLGWVLIRGYLTWEAKDRIAIERALDDEHSVLAAHLEKQLVADLPGDIKTYPVVWAGVDPLIASGGYVERMLQFREEDSILWLWVSSDQVVRKLVLAGSSARVDSGWEVGDFVGQHISTLKLPPAGYEGISGSSTVYDVAYWRTTKKLRRGEVIWNFPPAFVHVSGVVYWESDKEGRIIRTGLRGS